MKRKLMKNLLLIVTLAVLCLAVGVTASAEDRTVVDRGVCGAQGNNVIWTLYDDGELVISGEGDMRDYGEFHDGGGYSVVGSAGWYNYNLSTVTIKEGITHIGNAAFYHFEGSKNIITMVHIPQSVETIGGLAFYNCDYLTEMHIPYGVKTIGDYAFYGCENIANFEIPDSVINFGANAIANCKNLESVVIGSGVTDISFPGCSKLSSISVSDSNNYYSSDDYGVLFNKEKSLLVKYPLGNTRTSYTVPYGVETIGYAAFEDSLNLSEVILPESLITISDLAFRNCDSITNITIPSNVVDLGRALFLECDNLKNVIIEDGVTYISESMFSGCRSLENIALPDSLVTIEAYAFNYCGLKEIELPASVEFIGEQALSMGYNLEKIIVDPDNDYYSSDESGVLFDKDKTKLIQYPNGKIDKVYIVPETVTRVGVYAFCGLLDLEEVVLPEGLETLEVMSFACSPSLVNITIPSSVKKIGSGVFGYSMFIESIYIKSNDASFGEDIPLTIGNLRIAVSREEFLELGKCFVSEKDEDARNKISSEIYACLIDIDELDYPTIYCHSDSTTEAYAIEKAQENILEYNIPYVLTHFFEGDWTYDYDNMIRYRKCIHCDELETEALETTTDSDVEIIEPIDPDTDFVVDVITDYVVIEETISNNVAGDFEIVKAFDITMKNKDGVHVQPDGTVKVKLPLDWSKDGVYKVYRVNDDGTLTDMNAYREGSHMVFETDHFSVYVIVDESERPDEPTTPDDPQEETKKDFFSKIIDWFRSLIDLIISWFNK